MVINLDTNENRVDLDESSPSKTLILLNGRNDDEDAADGIWAEVDKTISEVSESLLPKPTVISPSHLSQESFESSTVTISTPSPSPNSSILESDEFESPKVANPTTDNDLSSDLIPSLKTAIKKDLTITEPNDDYANVPTRIVGEDYSPDTNKKVENVHKMASKIPQKQQIKRTEKDSKKNRVTVEGKKFGAEELQEKAKKGMTTSKVAKKKNSNRNIEPGRKKEDLEVSGLKMLERDYEAEKKISKVKIKRKVQAKIGCGKYMESTDAKDTKVAEFLKPSKSVQLKPFTIPKKKKVEYRDALADFENKVKIEKLNARMENKSVDLLKVQNEDKHEDDELRIEQSETDVRSLKRKNSGSKRLDTKRAKMLQPVPYDKSRRKSNAPDSNDAPRKIMDEGALENIEETLLFDSHCHLDLICKYRINESSKKQVKTLQDLMKVFPVFLHPTVGGMITNLMNPYQWARDGDPFVESILFQEEGKETVFYTVGCHPSKANQQLSWFSTMESLLSTKYKNCVAIGECGVDRTKTWISLEDQAKVFKFQIEMAMKLNKPLVFHIREAEQEALDIIEDSKLPSSWRIHRYSSLILKRRLYIPL